MAFDIASVLKGAANDSQEQIVRLDLDRIDPDPANFYSLDGIGELAGNIELIGLQQPLRVRPASEPGRYIVVSGHRRRAALLMIRDGYGAGDPGRKQWETAACIVEYGEASDAMRELRLIYANAATRVMTAAEYSLQAERVTELLYQLKEQGVEFPGRMRDHVAEACRISKSKLARLHAIRTNLAPGWLDRFDRGELREETAYQLQRLPKEIQDEADIWMETGKRKNVPIASVVEKVNRDLEKYQAALPCPSHAGGPDCHWKNERILKSLFAPYDWQVCDPGMCCRNCYNGQQGCGGACPECKDRRKLEKDVEKEKEAERKKAEDAQQFVRRTVRKAEARRLLPLIEAAGLKEDDELPGNYSWNAGTKVAEIRKMAAGDFGGKWLNDSSMLPNSAQQLKGWAKMLGCSTDYLLGLSEEPRPAKVLRAELDAATEPNPAPAKVSGSDTGGAHWCFGTPPEPGKYVLRAGVQPEEKQGSYITTIKTWTGDTWVDDHHVPMRLNVYRWILLPED